MTMIKIVFAKKNKVQAIYKEISVSFRFPGTFVVVINLIQIIE